MDIDLKYLDEMVTPDEYDEYGQVKNEYKGFNVNKGLIGLTATYGTALGVRHGIRHLTPLTQRASKRLKQASTRIEGYYKPGVGPKDKITLLAEHWKKGETPALIEYLEKYKNKPDPFGQTFPGGASPENLKNLKKGIELRGGMFGIGNAGIETADEFKWSANLEKAEDRLLKAQDINNERQIIKYRKASTRAKNMLRYEIQKTELIKHSFGEKINKARWKASGLGELKTSTLKGSLDGNTRALSAWKKSGGGLADDTKVTVSQYTGKDHSTLMKNAKNFGATYRKQEAPKALGKVLGRDLPLKTVKSNGIFKLTKQAHRMYEYGISQGMTKTQVFDDLISPWVENIRQNAVGNKNTLQKTNDMLTQFLKNHDYIDGRTKVNYSLVSTQQTVAGVNADIEIWRGKGKSYLRGGKGSLQSNVLVSDLYDVAGGAGSTTQKNLHMNVARSTTSGGNKISFPKHGPTRSAAYKALVNKDTKKLAKLFPKLSQKALLRLARLLIFRR